MESIESICKEITIIVKTFERKKSLHRLLHSINRYYPGIKVLVADDSRKSYKEETLNRFSGMNLEMYKLSFDSGISAGRNFLLNKVKTEYFVVVDDDNVFTERSNLMSGLERLRREKVDILGGIYENYYPLDSIYQILVAIKHPKMMWLGMTGRVRIGVFTGNIDDHGEEIAIRFNPKTCSPEDESLYLTDFINNFFIARTEAVREFGGWKHDELKSGEHLWFFIDGKRAGLKVMCDESLHIEHYPSRNFYYSRYRFRSAELKKKVTRGLGVGHYVECEHNGRILEEF